MSPAHLALGTTFTTAALVFGSWWLLLVGFMVCTAFTAVTLSRPKFWKNLAQEEQRLRLAELDVKDPALQSLVTAFNSGRSEIDEALAETPDDVKLCLRLALSALDELEFCAARLVLRAQELTSCLQVVKRSSLTEEVQRLGELSHRSVDEETQRDCDTILCWQREQLQLIDEVALLRERTLASLLRTVVIVKGFPSRIVGLRILDAQAKDSLSSDLGRVWEQIRHELQSSEEILKGMRSLPSPD
jgi:hypothetical protein